jgi:hypothetical protein
VRPDGTGGYLMTLPRCARPAEGDARPGTSFHLLHLTQVRIVPVEEGDG